MHMTARGVVLREVNYKESDKILTVLTDAAGRQTVSARGCRKKASPLAAAAQQLVLSEMTLYEYQGRWSLKEASILRQFRRAREDLFRLALGAYCAELTELLTVEDVPAPEILSLLLNTLHILDTADLPPEQVKAVFELKLMCLAGYEPLLDVCAVCGREAAEPRLHLREGVLHCAACRSGTGDGISVPVSQGTLAAMRHVVYGDPKRLFSFRLSAEGLRQMADVCEAFVLTQLERGFGTLDFYKRLTASPREQELP